MHFLARAALNEPVSTSILRNRPRASEEGRRSRLALSRHGETGPGVIWQPTGALIMDALAERSSLRAPAQVKRLVIDRHLASGSAVPNGWLFFTSLLNELRALEVTTVLTEEMRELFGRGGNPRSGIGIRQNMSWCGSSKSLSSSGRRVMYDRPETGFASRGSATRGSRWGSFELQEAVLPAGACAQLFRKERISRAVGRDSSSS